MLLDHKKGKDLKTKGLLGSIPTIGLVFLIGFGLLGSSCRAVGQISPDSDLTPPGETVNSDRPGGANTQIELTGLEIRDFSFEYNCEQKSIQLDLYQSLYDHYKSKNKIVYYDPESSDDWRTKTNLQFLKSSHDEEVITDLLDKIRAELGNPTPDEIVVAAVSLVQNLEYDCDKYHSYENNDGQDYETNYPYETLYLKSGVCGDSSLLLGKILIKLGYGASLLSYSDANHMAVGIECPIDLANYKKEGIGYCFIETTGPNRIGVVSELVGDVVMNESDLLIKISDGKSFTLIDQLIQSREQDVEKYGEFILYISTCAEISMYKNIIEQKTLLEEYEGKLKDLELALEPIYNEIEQSSIKFNELGCAGEVTSSLYKTCNDIFKEAKKQGAIAAPLEEEHNTLYSEYELVFEDHNRNIEAFDILMAENNSSCDVYTSDDSSLEE